jgi:hypothetical protein
MDHPSQRRIAQVQMNISRLPNQKLRGDKNRLRVNCHSERSEESLVDRYHTNF